MSWGPAIIFVVSLVCLVLNLVSAGFLVVLVQASGVLRVLMRVVGLVGGGRCWIFSRSPVGSHVHCLAFESGQWLAAWSVRLKVSTVETGGYETANVQGCDR